MDAIDSNKATYEFGGPIGAFCIIFFSHLLVYYLWISLNLHQGGLFYPNSWADWERLGRLILTGANPTLYAALIYLGYLMLQFILASAMPGVWVKGLPVPAEKNIQYRYLCNGISSWYFTLALVLTANYFNFFPLTALADNVGHLLTVAVITADLVSLGLYISAFFFKKQQRLSGNFIYDFFMGASLNPRLGKVDIKLFFDIRASWIFLFLLTLSAAVKQYEMIGTLSYSMVIILTAHLLYTNACMKGEECVPTTWDIFYEKCGWMLTFWNLVAVPFMYSFQSFYILKNNVQISAGYFVFVMMLLLVAYYVWDTANSQKNRFRMQLRGAYIPRKTFPQLPWGTLKNPRFLQTSNGSKLLTDGWYRYGRKIHYTADIIMAFCWGLSCGFAGFLPYLYPLFFVCMIAHRYLRDSSRCAKKYGTDWERYCKIVPYRFIPFIF